MNCRSVQPPATISQLPFGAVSGRGADAIEGSRERTDAGPVHLGGVGQARADGVDVGIDQAGNDGAATEVDDAGRSARQRSDFRRAADRGDLSVAHRERLRGGGVVNDDLAIEQDGVGGLRYRAACR